MSEQLDRIDKKLDKLCDLLNGLVTKVALHEQQLKQIPTPASLKTYAFFGGGVVMLLGVIGIFFSKILKL